MDLKNKNKNELLNILKKLMVLDERNIFYLEHKNNFIPILFLTDCGYNHFKGIQYPKNWIKIKKINDKIYNKLLNINISKNFVM